MDKIEDDHRESEISKQLLRQPLIKRPALDH